ALVQMSRFTVLVEVRFLLSWKRTTHAPWYWSALKPFTSFFCPLGLTLNCELAMRIVQPSSAFCLGCCSGCASGFCGLSAPAGSGHPLIGHSTYSLRLSFTVQRSLRSR